MTLSRHLGEVEAQQCGKCDNCATVHTRIDSTDHALNIIKLIKQVRPYHQPELTRRSLAHAYIGHKKYDHEKSLRKAELFGAGRGLSLYAVHAILQRMILKQYLDESIEYLPSSAKRRTRFPINVGIFVHLICVMFESAYQ